MNIIQKIVLLCAVVAAVSTVVAYNTMNTYSSPTVTWNVVDVKGHRLCFAKELVYGVGSDPHVVWYDQTANEGKESLRCWIDDTAIALERSGQRVIYRDISERGQYYATR